MKLERGPAASRSSSGKKKRPAAHERGPRLRRPTLQAPRNASAMLCPAAHSPCAPPRVASVTSASTVHSCRCRTPSTAPARQKPILMQPEPATGQQDSDEDRASRFARAMKVCPYRLLAL